MEMLPKDHDQGEIEVESRSARVLVVDHLPCGKAEVGNHNVEIPVKDLRIEDMNRSAPAPVIAEAMKIKGIEGIPVIAAIDLKQAFVETITSHQEVGQQAGPNLFLYLNRRKTFLYILWAG